MVNPRPISRIESEDPATRLAVLIDADNAQAAIIEGLLAEIARFGEATVKRIYGDFTSPHSAAWRKVLQKHACSMPWSNPAMTPAGRTLGYSEVT